MDYVQCAWNQRRSSTSSYLEIISNDLDKNLIFSTFFKLLFSEMSAAMCINMYMNS